MTQQEKRLTPARAIREKCRACVAGELSEITRCTCRRPVKRCDPSGCWLISYCHGHGVDLSRDPHPPTRLQAIRRECLNCQGGSPEGVRDCPSVNCSLYEFRFGKNPHKRGNEANIRAWKFKAARTATGPDSEPTEAPVPVERELARP